jgi:hypothetical protein
MTNEQAFLLISGIIFGIVAVIHALRLALRWQVKINQREIPMWLSVGGATSSEIDNAGSPW